MKTHCCARRTGTCAFATLLFTLLASGIVFTPLAMAQAPVRCAQVTSGSGGATIVDKSFGPIPIPNRLVTPGSVPFLTPSMSVASEWTPTIGVMCFGSNTTPKQQVRLHVRPSQEFIDELKARNLDVRVQSWFEGQSDEIVVMRDRVTAAVGRTVPLQNIYSVQWNYFADQPRYPFKPGETAPTVAPSMVIRLDYMVADVSRPVDGTIPSGKGLSIKILATGHESTALEIRPFEGNTNIRVGTCPAPAIRVDRPGSGTSAHVDFGYVSLDDLTMQGEAARAETFSVEFIPSALMSGDCARLASRSVPSLRFTSAGFYRNGMFEGDPNDAAYPGNRVVAVQLSNGAQAVQGANFGDPSTRGYLTFEERTPRRFTATLKRKPGATNQPGRFLIPVTLEAFYY